jgi:hypothetical protein
MGDEVLVGLLFADRVIEEINHKKTIVGTFTHFHSPRFPAAFPPWYVYAAATNIEPEKHNFSLVLCDNSSQMVVFSAGGEFEVAERTTVIELMFPMLNVTFPSASDYNLLFHIDGRQVGSRTLHVKVLEKSGG